MIDRIQKITEVFYAPGDNLACLRVKVRSNLFQRGKVPLAQKCGEFRNFISIPGYNHGFCAGYEPVGHSPPGRNYYCQCILHGISVIYNIYSPSDGFCVLDRSAPKLHDEFHAVATLRYYGSFFLKRDAERFSSGEGLYQNIKGVLAVTCI